LNARYKVYDEFYVLAGGQYLSINSEELGLGGGNPLGSGIQISSTEFGANIGGGYKYNILDNVNVFTEVKYVAIETGYVHGRLGLQFDF